MLFITRTIQCWAYTVGLAMYSEFYLLKTCENPEKCTLLFTFCRWGKGQSGIISWKADRHLTHFFKRLIMALSNSFLFSRNFFWRRQWHPTPVLLLEKSHGWRSLVGMELQRVGHDWVTSLSLFTFMHWRRKCNPFQYSCLQNPRDRGAWWAVVWGRTVSDTTEVT